MKKLISEKGFPSVIGDEIVKKIENVKNEIQSELQQAEEIARYLLSKEQRGEAKVTQIERREGREELKRRAE